MTYTSASSPSIYSPWMLLCHLLWLFIVLLLTPSAAAPLAWEEPEQEDPSMSKAPGFSGQVEKAAERIRQQMRTAPACLDYFEQLGVDLDAWLSPDQPPYVVPRRLHTVRRKGNSPICGAAQARPPFRVLYVDWYCFPRPRACELASLILHELGHLARQDTEDNEPRAFFVACRLSSCIDPGRFH